MKIIKAGKLPEPVTPPTITAYGLYHRCSCVVEMGDFLDGVHAAVVIVRTTCPTVGCGAPLSYRSTNPLELKDGR